MDYRKVNLWTIKDGFPIPKVADIFDASHGARWST